MFSSIWRAFFYCSFIVVSPLTAAWTPPEELSQALPEDAARFVVVDPKGNATAVWTGSDGTNTIIQTSSKPFCGRWHAPNPNILSQPGQDALGPHIVVDAKGNVTVVWRSYDGSNYTIQSAYKPFGKGWKGPHIISRPSQDVSSPRIAVDAKGNVTVVWRSYDGSNYRILSAYKPFEKKWKRVKILSKSSQLLGIPEVAAGGKGNVVVVWTDHELSGLTTIQASSRTPCGSWKGPHKIFETTAEVLEYLVVVDAKGNATVVWVVQDGAHYSIMATSKPFGKKWKEPDTLFQVDQELTDLEVAINAKGDIVAVWSNLNAGIIQAIYKPFGKGWEGTNTISQAGQPSFEPAIGIDCKGNATAVWRTQVASPYSSSIQSAYKPFCGGWQAPEIVSETHQADQFFGFPEIGVNPRGNAVAIWGLVTVVNGNEPSVIQASTNVLPPCKFTGDLKKEREAHKRHYHLKAWWTPSPSANIKKYRIYKRSKLVQVVRAKHDLTFKTHLFSRSSAKKFKIASVDRNCVESERKKIKVRT